MSANTSPIFSLTPNVGQVSIPTATANVKSDGVGTVATDLFKAFTAGANGSFIQRIRFMSVASAAAVTGVATTLRIFLSTVGSGATLASNTFLIGEISVPAIASDHSTLATNFYDFLLNMAIPTGMFIHVTQHVAQTANQNWVATAIGGDY
jgi:hypothetical protein